MTTYFLSYARTDQGIALRFADDLMAAGCSIWVDQYDIRPSQHWDRAVETAVRSCHGLIVMLSPASSASANVADEVSVAIDGGKDVIPILISKCAVPLRMSRMQFIDATEDYDRALRRCLSFITRAAPQAADQTAVPSETRTATTLPADVLQKAERRLTGVMGPIAARLVKAAARFADTEQALYGKLSESIPDAAERASFLGWMAQPGQTSVVTPRRPAPNVPEAETPIRDLDKITHALARQIGPIATQLVSREAKAAASKEDLCRRLAERISDPADRRAFLKDVGAA